VRNSAIAEGRLAIEILSSKAHNQINLSILWSELMVCFTLLEYAVYELHIVFRYNMIAICA